MPEQLVPETRLERFLSSIVHNTDVPDERRNRLELWLGAILKRNLPPDAPYDRLERWLKEIYENADYTAQFSGLNVEFWSGSEGNVKSITLPIEYVQSGSGDPSPENVRPISGFDSATVTRYGETESDSPLTVTTQFGRTVYGGTLNIITGELTATWQEKALAIADMNNEANYPGWKGQEWLWDYFPEYGSDFRRLGVMNICTGIQLKANVRETSSSRNSIIHFHAALDSPFGTLTQAEIKAAYPDMVLQIVIPLITPITYQLTPQQITTLFGVNHIYAKLYNGDTPSDVTITVKV